MKKIMYLSLAMFMWLICSFEMHAAYELVWSDEFDCDYLNTSVWSYETGGGGWGNGESQNYTNRTDNASVSNGILTITGKREAYNGSQFTSARIISKNKVMCKYGRIEALIKVPTYTSGVWPAFWMLGTARGGNWPFCGEIDILEMMCNDNPTSGNKSINTYHWNYQGINGGYAHGEWGQSYTYGEQLGAKWRIYGMEWTPQHMVGYVADADGSNKHYLADMGLNDATDANGLSAFRDYEFFFILNIALGGTYVGNIPANFQSCSMQVDWVRIYQDRVAFPTSTLTNNSAGCGNVPTINTDYVKVFRDEALNGSVMDWSSAPFYIWEGTMTGTNETPAEGTSCMSMTVGNKGWYGGGFTYSGSALDYRNLKDYTLHFRLKTSNTNPFTLTVGDKAIQFTPTIANQWREYTIPLSQINPTLGIDASFIPLSFNQGTNENGFVGRTFAWDDIYFYKPGGSNVANMVVNDASTQIKRKNGTTTMTISGSHLTGNVILTSSNSNFELSKTNLTPVNGTLNETITITYTGEVTANSIVTATCGGTEAQGRVFAYFSGLPSIDADYVVLMSDREFNGSVLNWGASDFNIWYTDYENPPQPTMTVVNNVNAFEGDGCIALQVGNKGWYGSGYVVNQPMDYENLNKYKLHFAYYSSSNQPFNVSVGGNSITITPAKTNAWVEYEVPVSSLYLQLGEANTFEPFTFMQGTGENVQAGRVLAFDDVYFYIEGGSGIANMSVGTPWTIDGQNGTAEFKISGSHLTGNISLTSSNSDFVLSKTSLTPVNGLVNETIYVTYTNTVAASSTIKAKCGELIQSVTATALGTSTRSDCALTTNFVQATPYMAHTWNWTQIYDYVYSVNGNSMNVTLNHETTTTWQAQFWMVPTNNLTLTQGNTYTVKAAILLNKACNVTVKPVQIGEGTLPFLFEQTVSVPAGQLYIFEKSAQAPAGMTDVGIVFDFGGNETGLEVQLFNVEVGETTCYEDLQGDDDPVVTDTENPTAPSNLNGTPSDTRISLTWTAASDNIGVTGYNIYVNGNKVASANGNSYTVTDLTASTNYTIAVEAYDAAGNVSTQVTRSFTTQDALIGGDCSNTFETYTASRNVVNDGNWYEVPNLQNINGNTATITIGNVNYQNVYVVLSGDDNPLEAGEVYLFSGRVRASKASTVSIYLESRSNNENHLFENNQISLSANTDYNFSVEATNPEALPLPDMTISIVNGPVNTTYTLSNVSVKKKNCLTTNEEYVVVEEFLKVMPNPASKWAYVDASKEIAAIEIFTLSGQKVAEFNNPRLEIAGLAEGLYLLKVRYDDGTLGQTKLIKQ